MISETRLQKIIGHFEYVQAKLAESPSQNELVSLSKEYAELKPICELIDNFKRVSLELSEAKELSSDPEFKEILRYIVAEFQEFMKRLRIYLEAVKNDEDWRLIDPKTQEAVKIVNARELWW